MTPKRKKAQDKLRRKYGYHTESNATGISIYKENNTLDPGSKSIFGNRTFNLCIEGDNRIINDRPIKIEIDDPDTNQFMLLSISSEELDLLATIFHELAEESNWKSQIRKMKI